MSVSPHLVLPSMTNSMLSALRWVDRRLEYPERRSMYNKDPHSDRAAFMLDKPHQFEAGDSLRTDIDMAGYFGKKALIDLSGKFDVESRKTLENEGFSISSIVCVGDNVSSWIIVGKHFMLEIRSENFD